MRTRHPQRWALAVVALAVCACSRFEELPAGLVVTCQSGSDCPAGRVCQAGRCVDPASMDTTPPVLASFAVTPTSARVGAGQPLGVTLRVSEPLAAPPRLTLGLDPAVDVPCAAEAATRYACQYTPTGAENAGRGGLIPLTLSMTDASGNAATLPSFAAVTLDFSPPALAARSVAPASVPLGGVVQVFFTTDEDLGPDPVLVASWSPPLPPLLAGGRTYAPAHQAGTRNYAFAYVVTAADRSGRVVFTASLADPLGNATSAVPVGTVTVDVDPIVVTTLRVTPARIRNTGTLTVAFDASEAASTLAATVGGLAMTCGAYQPTSPRYTCTRAMVGDEIPAGTEAAQSVVVTLGDDAGNRTTASGSAVFDFRAPGLVPDSVGVSVSPAPGALVPAVSAVSAGARVRVSFTADEPLGGAPVVTSGPEALTFTLVGAAGGTYVYEHVLSAGPHAQGPYGLQVTLTDVAGNVATAALSLPAPGLVVDTQPPAAPSVGSPLAIVYARTPWGTGATQGSPAFVVTGGAGAAEVGSTVVARDGAVLSTSREIGRSTVAADGSFSMSLIPADRPQVWILAVDRAGNASPVARVRDVTWTATLAGKVLGSIGENPHALESRPRFLGRLAQPDSTPAVLPASTRGTLAWIPTASSATPPSYDAVAFDAARGRLVVVAQADLPNVWEWNGRVWERVQPASITADGTPAGVAGITYDERRREVMVYDASCQPRLWSWDGSLWSARAVGLTAVEFNAGQRGAPGPHRASDNILGYDRVRGAIVLTSPDYAGVLTSLCGGGTVDDGQYLWSGSGWSSVPRYQGTSPLRGIKGQFLDPVHGALTLFTDGTGLLRWDGARWTAQGGAATAQWVAHDPVRSAPLLGDGTSTWAWSWSGLAWSVVAPDVPGGAAAVVTDWTGGRLLALNAAGVWVWSGTAWSTLRAPLPGSATEVALAFNPVTSAVEAFDSAAGVRRWVSGAWSAVTPTPTADGLPGSLDAAAAHAPIAGILAHEPGNGGVTWLWNGTSWKKLVTADGFGDCAMIDDPGRGLVLFKGIHDNGGVPDSAYLWNGAAWVAQSRGLFSGGLGTSGLPAYAPVVGATVGCRWWSNRGVEYDTIYLWPPGGASTLPGTGPACHYPLAADGSGRSYALAPDGSVLQLAADLGRALVSVDRPASSPPVLPPEASIWSPPDQAIVVAFPGQTWHLETEAASRPGQLFRVAYAAAGAPALADCLTSPSTCGILGVDYTWSGVGTPSENVSPTSVELSAWDGVRFVPLVSGTAAVGSQASVTGSVVDPAVLGLLGSASSEIDLAIRIAAGPMSAPLLRTDDVSVRVRYRLP